MDHKRIEKLDTAWDVYYEWLDYVRSEKAKPGYAFVFTFEQWLHVQYKSARIAGDSDLTDGSPVQQNKADESTVKLECATTPKSMSNEPVPILDEALDARCALCKSGKVQWSCEHARIDMRSKTGGKPFRCDLKRV